MGWLTGLIYKGCLLYTSALEEYKGVFVFAQQVDNVLDGVAFELSLIHIYMCIRDRFEASTPY